MTKWLEEIRSRMSDSTLQVVLHPVAANERVIATASKEVQALLNVQEGLRKTIKRGAAEHLINCDEDVASPKHIEELNKLRWFVQQFETLEALCWTSVRSETKYHTGNLGLREGFKVVTWDDKPEDKVDDNSLASELRVIAFSIPTVKRKP